MNKSNNIPAHPLTVTTHDGAFHPDEVIACAFIKRALNVEITRTRDNDVILASDFKIDVGGVHNPEMGQYDHHQMKEGDEHYGKSAAGLLYATMGLSTPDLDAFVSHLDNRDTRAKKGYESWDFTADEMVDTFYLQDNQHDLFCNAIIGLNHIDIHGKEQEEMFNTAVLSAEVYIQSIIDGKQFPDCSDLLELSNMNTD